ncbi:hypothetical protein PAMA_017110 [Pampus argenteus]
MASRHNLGGEVPRRKVSQKKKGTHEGQVPVCRLLCEVSGDCQAVLWMLLDRKRKAKERKHLIYSPRKQLQSVSTGNMLESCCFLLSALAKPQHKQQQPYRAPAADMSAQQRIYLNLPLALAVLRRPRLGPPRLV